MAAFGTTPIARGPFGSSESVYTPPPAPQIAVTTGGPFGSSVFGGVAVASYREVVATDNRRRRLLIGN